MFLYYIAASDDQCQASIQDLLRFCTGLEYLPPMGLPNSIKLEYMDHNVLPTASACYCILRLPAAAAAIANQETFFHNMDTGILGSKNHFGIL